HLKVDVHAGLRRLLLCELDHLRRRVNARDLTCSDPRFKRDRQGAGATARVQRVFAGQWGGQLDQLLAGAAREGKKVGEEVVPARPVKNVPRRMRSVRNPVRHFSLRSIDTSAPASKRANASLQSSAFTNRNELGSAL